MIVGAKRMGCSISEVLQAFNIPRSTVSCVHQEYVMEGINTHSGQCSGHPQLLNDYDWWCLARIEQTATLAEITSTFNVEGPTRISRRSVQCFFF